MNDTFAYAQGNHSQLSEIVAEYFFIMLTDHWFLKKLLYLVHECLSEDVMVLIPHDKLKTAVDARHYKVGSGMIRGTFDLID